MHDDFLKRLFEIFPHHLAENYIQAYNLIANYNPNRIDEAITILVHSEKFDDLDNLPLTINRMFCEELREILITLYVVPSTRDFNRLVLLLKGLYRAETSMDSAAIVEIIDSNEYLNNPLETFVSVLEHVDGCDWMETRALIHSVMPTLIRRLYQLHDDKVQFDIDSGPENTMERRKDDLQKFFKKFPNTATHAFISAGLLPVPAEAGKSLDVMTSTVYALEDDEQIATEVLAMAMIAPITQKSVAKQAKLLVDKLYADPTKAVNVNLLIDKLVRSMEQSA